MSEFTGERLVPGEVDQDLWNEHVSRYAFAASLCTGQERVIDAGCGTGYGSSLMAAVSGSVLGFDIAADAIAYAVSRYGNGAVRFCEGSCEAIPAESGSADLITAFEVIEHLAGWREFLAEAKRVLTPEGLLLVSTPNRCDYSEARSEAGPNPYHVHEFDFAEFDRELRTIFPHVQILGQNHGNSVVFCGDAKLSGASQLARANAAVPDSAYFFAICSSVPQAAIPNFVYVPEASNVLRERERHIQILKSDLAQKSEEHAGLMAVHRETELELKRSNEWAGVLNERLDRSGAAIRSLQGELERANEWAASLNGRVGQLEQRVAQLQEELAVSNTWAEGLNRELSERSERVVAVQDELAEQQASARAALIRAQDIIDERTRWAQQRDGELVQVEALLRERTARVDLLETELLNSRWVRLGRALRLGPLVQ